MQKDKIYSVARGSGCCFDYRQFFSPLPPVLFSSLIFIFDFFKLFKVSLYRFAVASARKVIDCLRLRVVSEWPTPSACDER